MSYTVRYFSNSGVGAADGTTWNDRASLYTSSGTWSSIIKNFPFASGADSLYCLVEGSKNYLCNEQLQGSILNSGTPTITNVLYFHGCNSSGVELQPPNAGWVSSQPPFETGTFPMILSSGLGNFTSLVNTHFRCFAIQSRSTGAVITGNLDWCYVKTVNSLSSSILAGGSSTYKVTNSCVVADSGFASMISTSTFMLHNVRLDGSATRNIASGVGTRNGLEFTSTGGHVSQVSVIGCAGTGIICAGGNTARSSNITHSLFINNGYGIRTNNVSGQTVYHYLQDTAVINCNVGLNADSGRVILEGCRFRDNVSGDIINMTNYPSGQNIFTAGTDSDEFVSTASGDYRMRYGGFMWGKGIGPGDETAPTTNVYSRQHPLGGF